MESQQEQAAQEVNLAVALGSDGGTSVQCFTVYVPNKDRNGQEIGNQRKWVLEAIRLLSEINGGATAMPPVEGGWMNEQGEIIQETPLSTIRSSARTRFWQTFLGFVISCTGWGGKPNREKSPSSSMASSTGFARLTPVDGGELYEEKPTRARLVSAPELGAAEWKRAEQASAGALYLRRFRSRIRSGGVES